MALLKDLLDSKEDFQATYFFFLTCIIAIARPALSIPHGNLVVNMQEKADTKIFHFNFSRQVSYIEGKNGCGDILRVCSVDML